MKYCSKCGNELFDEAVICPKCGCAVASENDNQITKKSHVKSALNTAKLLNVIALVLNIIIVVFFITPVFDTYEEYRGTGVTDADINITIGEKMNREEFRADKAYRGAACISWGVLAVATFMLSLKMKEQALATKGMPIIYLYFALSFATPVIPLIIDSDTFANAIICGLGLVFFVPVILQVIAATRYIKVVSLK